MANDEGRSRVPLFARLSLHHGANTQCPAWRRDVPWRGRKDRAVLDLQRNTVMVISKEVHLV